MQKLSLTNKYPPYSKYKDSGAEWLGDIPEHWNVLKLQRLYHKLKRTGFEKEELLSVYRDRGVIIKSSRSDNHNNASEDLSTYQLVEVGDLAINKMKAWQGSLAVSPHRGIVSPAYYVCRPLSDNDSKFIHYLLRSKLYIKQYEQNSGGVRNNQWDLRYEMFRKIEAVLPPKAEQEKIARFLDEQTARIDETIIKKQKLIELLKEEIVSFAQNEQMNGKGKTIRIRDLFKLAERPIELEDYSEYVALGLYNRGRGLFDKDPQLGKDIKESDFYKVIPRDLIISGQFAWEGAVALASKDEGKCVVSHRYYLLRDGVIKTEYLLALLMTKFGDHILNESSRGSAGRNRPLNIKIFLKEKIRVPSKETETKIESLLIKMSLVRDNIKKSIKLLQEYKSALISHAVTGKIKI